MSASPAFNREAGEALGFALKGLHVKATCLATIDVWRGCAVSCIGSITEDGLRTGVRSRKMMEL